MSKLSKVVLASLLMIAAVASAHAADLDKPIPTRVVKGIFTADSGEQIKFSIPEGRGLMLRDRESGASYRLMLDKLSGDRVAFSVIDAATETRVDGFNLALDGKQQHGKSLPIALTLTGVTTERKPPAPRLQKSTSSINDQSETSAGSCCVGCGIWEVCCYPSPGWCCTLECVGGDICGACSS